jgi:hypothetical protein
MKIEQKVTWRKVEERLARETNPKLRRNLETVLAHMKAEARGDLEGLMRTMAPDPSYTNYGPGPDTGPKGLAAVREFYKSFVESDCWRLCLDVDRLVVDEHCVVTEGLMRIAYPGRVLRGMGYAADDPDAYYLYEAHMAIFWPMDEQGRVKGEDSYTSRDGFEGILERKLRREDLPQGMAA